MIDYGKFSQRLAEREDRWGLLVEFQREWGFVGAGNTWAPPADSEGVSPAELDDDEEFDDDPGELALIPAAVTEWYALPQNSFMQAPRLFWTHPNYPPSRWPTSRMADRLAAAGVAAADVPPALGLFMGEYEACWIWAYREDEARADADPPVYVVNSERTVDELAADIADGSEATMNVKVARSVSEWALAFAASHLPFGMARLLDKPDELDPACVDRELVERFRDRRVGALTEEQRDRVRTLYPELGLLPWWDFNGGTLRGGPDVVLILAEAQQDWPDFESDLSIAARTPEALAAALAAIGIGIEAVAVAETEGDDD